MPYFPSLWQLSKFLADALANQYSVVLFFFAVVFFIFANVNWQIVKPFVWLLLFSFLFGFSISNGMYLRKTMLLFQQSYLILLYIMYFMAIALVVATLADENQTPKSSIPIMIIVIFLFWKLSMGIVTDFMDFPRYGDYQFLVWSDENRDYVYSCKNPRGSLFEVSYEKDGEKKITERRVYFSDQLKSICERLYPE